MTFRRTVALAALLLAFLPGSAAAQLTTQLVAQGLTNPVAFVADPLDPSTFYVVEQRGTIRMLRNGTLSATFFLDLRPNLTSGGERGLLGLAFTPDTATT